MGAINTTSMQIAGHLGELVGYKAGLALTREELAEHLVDSPDIQDAVLVTDDRWVRVRSEEYEAAVNGILYRVGNIPTADPLPPGIAVFRRYAHDPIHSKMIEKVLTRCLELLNDEIGNTPQETPIDPSHLLETVASEFGSPGLDIATELIDAYVLQLHTSPWLPRRSFDWVDTVQLRDLFQSESLETQYGKFFDQRFVDYLAQNFGRIDEIHWRKFEGLAGEFFERAGFQVEMGPGRGDGGVDIRVWAPADAVEKPPLILVQCKRQQEKVSQLVLKALWADVSDEGAQSGFIVTTSALAPSAKTVRKARGYPISAVERGTLKDWMEQLRSPGTGTFLA